jgi:hypothetical protein
MMELCSKKRDAAPQPEPVIEKPAPHVPRKSVFLVVNGRWMEGGEVHTCGRHREISLPVEISSAALRHGHACLPRRCRGLQDFAIPDRWSWPLACLASPNLGCLYLHDIQEVARSVAIQLPKPVNRVGQLKAKATSK